MPAGMQEADRRRHGRHAARPALSVQQKWGKAATGAGGGRAALQVVLGAAALAGVSAGEAAAKWREGRCWRENSPYKPGALKSR